MNGPLFGAALFGAAVFGLDIGAIAPVPQRLSSARITILPAIGLAAQLAPAISVDVDMEPV
jgi:hypothetical protein